MSGTLTAALDRLSTLLSPTELSRVADGLRIDGGARRAARTVSGEKRGECVALLVGALDQFSDAGLLAATLSTIAAAAARHPSPPTLVWSGPHLPGDSVRTTEAIVRLIDEAEESVLASTYSATVDGAFVTALRRAADRKLQITVIADVAKLGGTARAIATAIPRATLLGYHHSSGQWHGVQHSKFLVIDGRATLVTSANLSTQAVEMNLEAGVLIEDDPTFASQIARRVADLVASGHLRELA